MHFASLLHVITLSIDVDNDTPSSFGFFKFKTPPSAETCLFKSISLSLFNIFDVFLFSCHSGRSLRVFSKVLIQLCDGIVEGGWGFRNFIAGFMVLLLLVVHVSSTD